MKNFIRLISFFLLIQLIPASGFSAGRSATEVMRKAASSVSAASGISASFSMSGSHSLKGTIKASGRKFTVITGGNNVWYNGKSLYTYNRQQNETTLTTPSAEELSEVNPLLYVSGWEKSFTASFAPNRPASGYMIVLTPKSKRSGVKKAIVSLTPSCLPTKIVIRTSSGENLSIAVSGIKRGIKFPASTFDYPARKYPKTKIIKL